MSTNISTFAPRKEHAKRTLNIEDLLKQRIKSVCLIKAKHEILFSIGTVPESDFIFLIPIGGGVEFQELAIKAAIREVNEELGVEIQNPVLIEVFENIFNFNGEEGHEIIFCYFFCIRQVSSVKSRVIPPGT